MKKILFEDALIYNAIRGAEALVNVLPHRAALASARALGGLYARVAKRRKIAYVNLRAAFAGEKSPAELRRIVRRNFENFAMNIAELLRAPRFDERYFREFIRAEGLERIEKNLREKRGVVLLTAHFGNWELMSLYGSGHLKYPTSVFARIQKHPRSDAYLNQIRASQGAEVVFRGMQARQLVDRLKEGKLVGILGDQDGGPHGTFVPFLGRLASFPRGVVHFARRAAAPIIPVFDFREKDGHHRIVVEDEIRVDPGLSDAAAEEAVIGAFARSLERRIREEPEQWLWPHKRWKSTPTRRCVILSDGKPGHAGQSLAFYRNLELRRAKAGYAKETLSQKTIQLRFRSPLRKKILNAIGFVSRGRFPWAWAILGWALEQGSFRELEGTHADYVISCGSGTEAANLIFSAENGARSCFIHKPQFGGRLHAVVILPRHDGVRADDNIFGVSGALIFQDAAARDESRRSFLASLRLEPAGRPRLGFIVGGKTRRSLWDTAAISRAAGQIKSAYAKRPFDLFVTSSRRTDVSTENLLKRSFADFPPCRKLVIANESNPEGVYAGILAAGDFFVVTADSVSMVSEACATGKPVLALIPNEKGELDRKLRAFLASYEESGRLKICLSDDLAAAIASSPAFGGAVSADGTDDGVLEKAASRLMGL